MRIFILIALCIFQDVASGQKINVLNDSNIQLHDLNLVFGDTLERHGSSMIQNSKTIDFYQQVPQPTNVILPPYEIGLFCKFENQINRNRKLQINFGTD